MSLAILHTRANIGIDAPLVIVETHLSSGLPGFSMVGLPETAVRESKERVRSAILNSGFEFPAKRITVNLAPADFPKAGGRYDLAIAISILAASKQLPMESIKNVEFFGELALSGHIRGVMGVIPAVVASQKASRVSIIPLFNSQEASLLQGAEIRVCNHLLEVCAHLKNESCLPLVEKKEVCSQISNVDMSDVVGQSQAKRALTIAAAGGHNLLMRGPPGTGKTMLASRLSTILPPLNDNEALELASIHSISKKAVTLNGPYFPPFRAPHHTCSGVALVGGGTNLNIGEISLAHNGVLFLDELPEFSPKVLEVMREPLESGYILISRTKYQVRLPAKFQLIAAMNPCPCGYYGDDQEECTCLADRAKQYQQRVSGPLMDRIDLHVELTRLSKEDRSLLLKEVKSGNSSSEEIRKVVIACKKRQFERAGKSNSDLSQKEIQQYCNLTKENEMLLDMALDKLKLSTRAYFRILKIARTIADLECSTHIKRQHLLEAINYRKFDRRF